MRMPLPERQGDGKGWVRCWPCKSSGAVSWQGAWLQLCRPRAGEFTVFPTFALVAPFTFVVYARAPIKKVVVSLRDLASAPRVRVVRSLC
jgi:hypothetical protein